MLIMVKAARNYLTCSVDEVTIIAIEAPSSITLSTSQTTSHALLKERIEKITIRALLCKTKSRMCEVEILRTIAIDSLY